MQILKVRQLWLFAIIQFLFLMNGMAQYKSYKLSETGDTLNAIDLAGKKQGKWIVHVDEIRGEPGYEEEGVYKNDKKEGVWRVYNLNSDLIAVENYKLGGKHGIQQYYTYLGELYREESWLGYDPESPYDTIPVYGEGNNEIVDFKIVKAEQYSVKHGDWKFYDPAAGGRIIKVENYFKGHLQKPGGGDAVNLTPVPVDKNKKVEKTPEMLEWEKKNKGKKKALRDGRTTGG
jgi:antitoxin component YwqK of YwqJK toxin-antitoxin module